MVNPRDIAGECKKKKKKKKKKNLDSESSMPAEGKIFTNFHLLCCRNQGKKETCTKELELMSPFDGSMHHMTTQWGQKETISKFFLASDY